MAATITQFEFGAARRSRIAIWPAARRGRRWPKARRACPPPRCGRGRAPECGRRTAPSPSRCAITMVVRGLHQSFQRLLHQRLALGVERGGRLVEQQQRRLAQDRARNRDALALAAGKRDAALADRRIEALRHARDEFGGARSLRRPLDLGVARAGAPEADVLAHATRQTPPRPAAPARCASAPPRDRRRSGARRRASRCRRADRRSAR